MGHGCPTAPNRCDVWQRSKAFYFFIDGEFVGDSFAKAVNLQESNFQARSGCGCTWLETFWAKLGIVIVGLFSFTLILVREQCDMALPGSIKCTTLAMLSCSDKTVPMQIIKFNTIHVVTICYSNLYIHPHDVQNYFMSTKSRVWLKATQMWPEVGQQYTYIKFYYLCNHQKESFYT